MPEPLVTIVICTRNRGARLHVALDALSRIRSRHEWDALIVDNASTDNTAEVIRSHATRNERFHYSLAERIGLGAARDHAWRVARGAILAFTDDDCYPAPDFVEALVEVFEERQDVALVGGRILLYDQCAAKVTIDIRETAEERLPHSYIEAGFFQGANIAIRSSALERIGGFDPELGAGTPFPCEDIDVAAAISWAGFKTRFDPRPVVYHDHGRVESDLPALRRGYDAGRGAYYAKYLLREDSRVAYLKGWGGRLLRHDSYEDIVQFSRELRSGLAYARQRGRAGFVLAGIPAAIASLAGVSMIACIRSAACILPKTWRRRFKNWVRP